MYDSMSIQSPSWGTATFPTRDDAAAQVSRTASAETPSAGTDSVASRTDAAVTGRERNTAAEAAALDTVSMGASARLQADPAEGLQALGVTEAASPAREVDAPPTATRRAVAGYEAGYGTGSADGSLVGGSLDRSA